MEIQKKLNKYSLEKLGLVIDSKNDFFRNQMYCYALREMLNSIKPIDKMNKKEKEEFIKKINFDFDFKGWK